MSTADDAVVSTCRTIEYNEFFTDPKTGCKSKVPVKQRRCDGSCSAGMCCIPKVKSRQVRLVCTKTGTSYMYQMPMVRKCQCKRCP